MKYLLLLSFFMVSMLRLTATEKEAKPVSQLIYNVWVIDGTGAAAKKASVRIQNKKIIAVGTLKPLPGELLIDGNGRTLTPGFIDTHSHLLGSFSTQPEAIAALNQGVTLIVAGQDGEDSPIDNIRSQLKAQSVAVDIIMYFGRVSFIG